MPRATVKSVDTYNVEDTTVTLFCTVSIDPTSEHEKYALKEDEVPLQLEFIAPHIFRFSLFTDNTLVERFESPSDIQLDAFSSAVSISVEEDAETLSLRTSALTVTIGLVDWSFSVIDHAGETLLEESAHISAKGEPRTHQLGYTLEQINRWPYKIDSVSTSFELYADEHIYGLGEKFTDLDKRGQTITSWVTQANGSETELAYKNVPFYLSSEGYGFLVDTFQRTTFDLGDSSAVSKEISVDDDVFSYVFIGGPEFTDIIDDLTKLLGRPSAIPKWSLGVWMSRLGYQTREELETVTSRLRETGMPCDVVHLDPPWLREDSLCDFIWDRESFPDPEGMITELHDTGFKLCLWEYPYLLSSTDAFDEALANDYLINNSRGRPYLLSRLSWASDRGGIVDFTNPAAREWWKAKHQPLLDMGVDVFKTDFGEYVPKDAVMSNGSSGRAARNQQSLLYTKTVYEAMEEAGTEPLLWARPAWTGSHRYPVHWGGDPDTSFGALAASLRGGLSLGLCGFAFWSCDIGGFSGEPSPELYIRWAQVGLLGMSHARFHGTTPREPWEYGAEAEEIVKEYALERYRILPYLHRLVMEANTTGIPVMRPMVLEFQHDPRAADLQTQHMLGDALLVAPVLRQTDRRDVYFPPGLWVDHWSGECITGPQTRTVDAPLDTMPLYQRAGTILPTREPTQYVDEENPERIDLLTVLGEEDTAETSLYTFDPEGEQITVEHTSGTIRVTTETSDCQFSLTLRGLDTKPESVEINGIELSETNEEPADGQWNYDATSQRLRAHAAE